LTIVSIPGMLRRTSRNLAATMRPEQLHVISVLSNPVRYQSRGDLARPFIERIKAAGVTLWLGEAAHGERDYEVTCADDPRHVQMRTNHELWLKESMINAVAQRLPLSAKYIMWLDADVDFVRQDWAVETLHQLQNHPVVQVFSHAVDLGPHQEVIQQHTGFAHQFRRFNQQPNTAYSPHMHPGYGWAWRREAWDHVGGMLDFGICGAGDHHMSCALIGAGKNSVPGGLHPNYLKQVLQWEQRAAEVVKGDIGYVPGAILHYFHGHKADRKYQSRWDILKKSQYDPETDITRDSQGLLRLRGNKPGLRNDLQRYFRERNEDAR
jgi:hypothetical protein